MSIDNLRLIVDTTFFSNCWMALGHRVVVSDKKIEGYLLVLQFFVKTVDYDYFLLGFIGQDLNGCCEDQGEFYWIAFLHIHFE